VPLSPVADPGPASSAEPFAEFDPVVCSAGDDDAALAEPPDRVRERDRPDRPESPEPVPEPERDPPERDPPDDEPADAACADAPGRRPFVPAGMSRSSKRCGDDE
jgi:hypothetical protein